MRPPMPKSNQVTANDIMAQAASSKKGRFSRYRPPSAPKVSATPSTMDAQSVYSYQEDGDDGMSVFDNSVYGMSVVDGMSCVGGGSVMGGSVLGDESLFDAASLYHDNTIAGGTYTDDQSAVWTTGDAGTLGDGESGYPNHEPVQSREEPMAIPMTIALKDSERKKRAKQHRAKAAQKWQEESFNNGSQSTNNLDASWTNQKNEGDDTVGPLQKVPASPTHSPIKKTISCAETDASSFEYSANNEHDQQRRGSIGAESQGTQYYVPKKKSFWGSVFGGCMSDEAVDPDAQYYTFRNERRASF